MAKKDSVDFDDLDLDDLEGLDDLDYDGDDLFPDEDSGDRNPRTDFTKTARDVAKKQFLDSDKIKRLIGKTLGKGFSGAIDTYDELSKGISEVVGANEQEGRKLIRDVTGIVDETAPGLSSKIPEWMRSLEKGIREENYDGSDGDQSSDSELDGQLKGINDLLKFTKKNEVDKLKREHVNRLKDAKIADSTIKSSSMTINAIRRLSQFNEKVTINYQKKSLEQGYKIINILAKTHELHTTQYGLMNEFMSNIQTNTALPDFVKMKGAEFIKASLRQRMADATINKLSGGLAPIFQRLKGQLGEGIAAMGMVTDRFDVDEGTNAAQILGSIVGDFAGGWARDKSEKMLEKFVAPHLKKIPGLTNADNLLREYGGNLPMVLNTLASKGHSNPIIDNLLSMIAPERSPVKITGTGFEELEDPSYFDVRTHRTINDIIPAYLSSMDRNIHKLATGEFGEEKRWSHFDGKLVSKTESIKGLMDFGVKQGETNQIHYTADVLMDKIGAWEMGESSQKALRREITKRLLKGVTFDVEELSKENYWKDYSEHVGREISSTLRRRFGIDTEGKFKDADSKRDYLDFHQESYEAAEKSMKDYGNRFNTIAGATNLSDLVDAGLLKKNPSGEYEVIEDNFLDGLLQTTGYEFNTFNRMRLDLVAEEKAKKEAVKNELTSLFGKSKRKLLGALGLNKEDIKEAIAEDNALAKQGNHYSQNESVTNEETYVDGLDEANLNKTKTFGERIKGYFSKKAADSGATEKLRELREILKNKSLDDIMQETGKKYDEFLSRDKAKELREFLLKTKTGKLAYRYIKQGEEAVESGVLDDFKQSLVSKTKSVASSAKQTASGFAKNVRSSKIEDVGVHERLDLLNELTLSTQTILSEMLEVTLQMPFVVAGGDVAGLRDLVMRNRQGRLTRFARYMRDQPGRLLKGISDSRVGRFAGGVKNMVGSTAGGLWSAAGLLGRGLRGTMGLALEAGKLATQGTVGGLKAAGGLLTGGVKGFGNMLPGIGRGVGNVAMGAGSILGGALKGAGGLLGPAGELLGSLVSTTFNIGKDIAKSPIKGLKALGKAAYGGKDEYRDYDAYVRGEENPRIRSNLMKEGGYKDLDGNIIKSLDQISSAVYDSDDNVVISEVEYASKITLYTASGKKLITLGSLALGTSKGAAVLRRILRPVRKVSNFLGSVFTAIVSAPFKLVGGVMGRIKNAFSSGNPASVSIILSHSQLEVQYKIFDLLKDRLRKGGGSSDDVDENSWEGRQLARKMRSQKTLNDVVDSVEKLTGVTEEKLGEIAENTEGEKKGIFARILDSITGLGGILASGFSSLGAKLAATAIGSKAVSLFTGARSAILAKGLIGATLGGLKSAAVWAGTGLVSLVGAPALIIGGLTIAAVAGGALLYKGYKRSTAKKMYLTYLRMLEYGVDPSDESIVGKIAGLEHIMSESLVVNKNGDVVSEISIPDGSIDLEKTIALFGYSEEQLKEYKASNDIKSPVGKFMNWLVSRFLPVYKGHVHAAVTVTGKTTLSEIDKDVTGSKGIKYLSVLKTALSSYFRMTRYGSPSAAYKDRDSSPFYSNWFRKDVWATEEDIQAAYDRAEMNFRQQETNKASSSGQDSLNPYTKRGDLSQLKYMKENSVLEVSASGTADLKQINSGIKGGGFFSSAMGANKFVKGDEYSMTRNLDKLDAGSAIRYMAYGLHKMEMVKVEQLWLLENYVLDQLPYDSGRFEYPEGLRDKAKSIFSPKNDEDNAEMVMWLEHRFIEVLKAYVNSLLSMRKGDPISIYKNFSPVEKYKVISSMLDSISSISDKKKGYTSVWDLEYTPWSGYVPNGDSSSISPYKQFMEKAVENKEIQTEVSKSILTGKGVLAYQNRINNLPASSIYNTKWSGGTKDKGGPAHRTGTSLLTYKPDNIISSGRPHSPVKGPGAEAGEAALLAAIREAGITDPEEIAMILGQVAEESGGFKSIEENLNYRADRMIAVWPGRFKSRPDFARKLAAAGPEAIANEIYGGRMGNTEPGDGWKYRGRGYIQLTGKDNYKAIGDYLGIDLVNNPDLVTSSPEMAAKTAIGWWMVNAKRVRGIAQRGNVREVTRAINGGYTNYDQRVKNVAYYRQKVPELLANPPVLPASGGGLETIHSSRSSDGTSDSLSLSEGAANSVGILAPTKPPVSATMASKPVPSKSEKDTDGLIRMYAEQNRREKEKYARMNDPSEKERIKGLKEWNEKWMQRDSEFDPEAKGLMGDQLSAQERSNIILSNMNENLAKMSEALTGQQSQTKTHSTRSVPSSSR